MFNDRGFIYKFFFIQRSSHYLCLIIHEFLLNDIGEEIYVGLLSCSMLTISIRDKIMKTNSKHNFCIS